jgi:hypothetical protein
MIAQIQTHFSHFISKPVALALFLFILTSFNLQIITANAQPETTPSKPATTDTKATTNTQTTTGKNILTQPQVDDRIGTLKNCTVNAKNETELKTDPNAANNFIFKCLKDIIQIVITISVILAVMRLIFVGIQFLNTFGDEGKLQAELAKAITGFIAGAVILGLFATIIQVVNPSALRIDKIFSAQVIADYKCLNKGIGDVKGVVVSGAKTCTSNSQGSGPTTSSGVYTSESIAAVFSNQNPDTAQKAKQNEILQKITECNSTLYSTSKDDASKCSLFQEYANTNPGILSGASGITDAVVTSNSKQDIFANGNYKITKIDTNFVTASYTATGSSKPKNLTLTYDKECAKTPFDDINNNKAEIKAGEQINFAPCVLTISK